MSAGCFFSHIYIEVPIYSLHSARIVYPSGRRRRRAHMLWQQCRVGVHGKTARRRSSMKKKLFTINKSREHVGITAHYTTLQLRSSCRYLYIEYVGYLYYNINAGQMYTDLNSVQVYL